MAKSPFRDRELAEKHRAEREADDQRVRADEEAEAARERERQKKLLRQGAPVVGLGAVVWGLVKIVGIFATVDDRHAEEVRRRELAAAVAATKPAMVDVDQGGVRPSSDSVATADSVRTVVDLHADELAGCFSDGLGDGSLAMGQGPSHAFAFSWAIEADGAVSNARPARNAAPTAAERCIMERIGTWSFGAVRGKAEVVAWMFERCPTTREECVHPK